MNILKSVIALFVFVFLTGCAMSPRFYVYNEAKQGTSRGYADFYDDPDLSPYAISKIRWVISKIENGEKRKITGGLSERHGSSLPYIGEGALQTCRIVLDPGLHKFVIEDFLVYKMWETVPFTIEVRENMVTPVRIKINIREKGVFVDKIKVERFVEEMKPYKGDQETPHSRGSL